MKKFGFVKEFIGVEKTFLKRLLFNRPFLKFLILIIIQYLILHLSKYLDYKQTTRIILTILSIAISIYFIAVIIYVVKRTITKLKNPQSLRSLIFEYSIFIFGILLVFSTGFNLLQVSDLGYLTYGSCSNNFVPNQINIDTKISEDFFYFSAITFFSVGYGDICPMGLAKYWAILTAFTGHLVSVILIGIIINNYLRIKRKKETK